MIMNKPNYKRSLLSLATSVLKHYGVEVWHDSLPEMDELLSRDYKNVVVMLFDGMGESALKNHLDNNAFLRVHDRGAISSVFPPTTTAATTTIESGLAPIEHAWLGWCLRFDEIDKSVCLFPNNEWRKENQAASYHVASEFIPYKSIFERIEEGTKGEVKAYLVSKYSNFATQNLDEIVSVVRDLCNKDGRKYIYTYYNQPDYDMHDLGVDHASVKDHIIAINNVVESLAHDLKDTLIIVTADHGLIDTKWEFIPEYDDINCCFEHLPTIESRAMTFHIKDGMHAKFESAFNKHFGKYYELLSHDEVIESGIFGEGKVHPHFASFIGDYLAIATSDVSLEVEGRTDDIFKGVHAGSTLAEFEVPFIVVAND